MKQKIGVFSFTCCEGCVVVFIEILNRKKIKSPLIKICIEREKIKESFEEYKRKLQEVSEEIEDSQDLDGNCKRCPRFWGGRNIS